MLDEATRYHRSEFLDPFGVLGLHNATPVNEVSEHIIYGAQNAGAHEYSLSGDEFSSMQLPLEAFKPNFFFSKFMQYRA